MQCLAEPGAQEGARDAQQNRDDAPSGVTSRHQQLRQPPGQAAEDDDDQQFVGIEQCDGPLFTDALGPSSMRNARLPCKCHR